MSPGNCSHALAFLLTGILGMARFHRWVFFQCNLFPTVIAVLGNGTILLIISVNRRLRQTMYYFLSMLATTDLGLSLSTLPTVLRVFWFGTREISFPVCLIQVFCIHAFSVMESSVLLPMAFDRYMAICYPLRYSSILTSARIAKIGLGMVCRSLMLLLLICLLTQPPFCRSHVLSHSYCLHQDMIWLACTDSTLNSMYGLTLVLFVILDSVFIVLSYTMIINASREEQAKALNACVSHFCSVLIFYVPMVGPSIIHWYGKNAAPFGHVLMATIYLFVPPVLKPIIHSMKNKPICKSLLGLLCQRLAWPGHGQQP
ncbi:O51I2 protein, partial [Pelecanoides urinatrix]|nr:O51I2 protein [Pelecanoides urinatrix]